MILRGWDIDEVGSPKDGYHAFIKCLLFGMYVHYFFSSSYFDENSATYFHFTVGEIEPQKKKKVSNLPSVIQLVRED